MEKRKAVIECGRLNSKENPYYVDFTGFQEGSGSPCCDMEEVKEQIELLLARYGKVYNITIINKLEEQKTLL
jgi:uncharacterized protein YuzE